VEFRAFVALASLACAQCSEVLCCLRCNILPQLKGDAASVSASDIDVKEHLSVGSGVAMPLQADNQHEAVTRLQYNEDGPKT
jgi:hypothetical protein